MTAIEDQIVQEGAWLLEVICIAGISDTLRAYPFNTALLQAGDSESPKDDRVKHGHVRCFRSALCSLLLCAANLAAQGHVPEPVVNLGDTSFWMASPARGRC
jgi:hypothetical protein